MSIESARGILEGIQKDAKDLAIALGPLSVRAIARSHVLRRDMFAACRRIRLGIERAAEEAKEEVAAEDAAEDAAREAQK